MTHILSDKELLELLPKITNGSDKPKTQLWFTQAEVLKIMRDTETKVLENMKKDFNEQNQPSTESSFTNLIFNT